ncbi:PAS domain-containing protein [Haloprofundus sp. MHR1]|uniref:PAS domain-containing protein n=1 Tax=Haloprofundus sp. MHR1 TaxID=2572921 RepID=UPI0010BEE8AB|nr:PAS domain-containing protein [Haloprofundus sp. MHR1]QCJ47861.1 PAS domain S-box protein [Haloprofundus sp. MHR1]
MDTSSSADGELRSRVRQQEVVAELGQQALEADDLDALMRDATAAVAETLDCEYCKVLELLPDGETLFLRQGVGWRGDLVGAATIPADRASQAGYTLATEGPVVVDDLRSEERFSGPGLLTDHDIVSGISVVVGSVERPWGILGVHATQRLELTEHDASFVQSVANILASAIENERTQHELDEIYGRISDAFFALDEEWRFTYLNERAHELVNPEGRTLVGERIWTAFPEAESRAFKSKYERAMYEQETVSFEEYYPDPLDTWFEVRAYPSETGLSVYFRDVTDRKERERALEQSEQRYRTLAESFPNGIVTLFDDDLRYTLAVGRAFDYLPVSPSDVEHQTPSETWGDDVGDALEPAMREALDGGEASVEVSYVGREWSIHVVPIADEEGEIFAGMTMAQDITEQKAQERELREAKTQLEAATDAGAVGTWEWDIRRDEMVVGRSFAKTFGIDPEAAREGVPLDRYVSAIHEDDRDRVTAEIEEAVESCGEYESEYRVRNVDGEFRWVVARGHVECDDGTPVTFPGALTDITERKRAELELQRNKNQLESLFEVLPIGVVVAEADGRLVEANDTAKEIGGGDVFDAESIAEYARFPAVWAESGEAVDPGEWTMSRVLDGEEVTDPDVYEIEAADGERRIVSAQGMPVRGADGEVTRGVVTVTDITERRENQRRVEESERRYRTLVEHFPDGAVGLFDDDLKYTAAGGQLMDEIGISAEDRVGNRVSEIYPDELVEQVEPYFHAALDGEANSFEVEFHDRHLLAHTLPVRDADEAVFAGMLVVQDVTERREYERMLETSNERLEQFAYVASHDLQEPLRMVSSYLQLVERRYGDELDEDGREFLEFAVDGADRMREMLDGLLKYSRINSRQNPFETVDLDDVLADVRDDLAIKIEDSDAEIEAETLPHVYGDEGQLRQVFQNLLDNTIKYSGDKPPRVNVAAERNGTKWTISVSDEGIGIDPDDADRIFGVFQRLHGQSERDGTGIGLALCERIIERHDGDIWVESEPGEGATFSFTLPAAGGRGE